MADEPTQITIGDSATWTKTLSDYPPSAGWALAYRAARIGGLPGEATLSIASTGSGAIFTVALLSTDTASWPAGDYLLTGYVTKTTDRHVIGTTPLSILPDPTGKLGSTHAARTLALIELALEGRIPRGLESHAIDGQPITKIPIAQLYSLKQKYKAEVLAEQARAGAAAGIAPRRRIGFRFVNP